MKKTTAILLLYFVALFIAALFASCGTPYKGYHRTPAKSNWAACGAGLHSLRITK